MVRQDELRRAAVDDGAVALPGRGVGHHNRGHGRRRACDLNDIVVVVRVIVLLLLSSSSLLLLVVRKEEDEEDGGDGDGDDDGVARSPGAIARRVVSNGRLRNAAHQNTQSDLVLPFFFCFLLLFFSPPPSHHRHRLRRRGAFSSLFLLSPLLLHVTATRSAQWCWHTVRSDSPVCGMISSRLT